MHLSCLSSLYFMISTEDFQASILLNHVYQPTATCTHVLYHQRMCQVQSWREDSQKTKRQSEQISLKEYYITGINVSEYLHYNWNDYTESGVCTFRCEDWLYNNIQVRKLLAKQSINTGINIMSMNSMESRNGEGKITLRMFVYTVCYNQRSQVQSLYIQQPCQQSKRAWQGVVLSPSLGMSSAQHMYSLYKLTPADYHT